MKINRLELLEVLDKIKPGLTKKGIVEEMTHFIFTGKDVITFSDQIAIVHPFPLETPFSVKGEEFYKLIKGINEEEFDLSIKEDKIIIKSDKTKASISTVLDKRDKIDSSLISLKKDMRKEWNKLPKDFIMGLRLTAFSAAKDLSMGTFSCIYIKENNIFSSDRIRVSWFNLSENMSEFLISAIDAQELSKFEGYSTIREWTEGNNWVHFKTGDGVTFSIKKILGIFKEIKHLFDIKGEVINLPEELQETLNSISFIAEGDIEVNKIVHITIENNTIICKAEKEIGWVEKIIECDYERKQLHFLVNPIFLSQVLAKSASMTLTDKVALFETENFKHIIALPMEG